MSRLRRQPSFPKPSVHPLLRAMRDHIQLTGRTYRGFKAWTVEEFAVLDTWYPDYRLLQKHLPDRTRSAIWHIVSKRGMPAKIGKVKRRWSPEQLREAKKFYETASREELESSSWLVVGIRRLGSSRGWKRPPPRFKPSGDERVDQVKARCASAGIKLGELDDWLGLDGYFRGNRWRYSLGKRGYRLKQANRLISEYVGPLG